MPKPEIVLVANRGEIALRVFRTAKRMGMRTVAVYSDADTNAPHVRAADETVRIGPAPAPDSYLNRDAIVAAAKQTSADLVHPGYGFLAEDDRFAADCEAAGLIFVGPPPAVLRAVGDKIASRALAEEAGVPVLDGYGGDDQTDAALTEHAARIGYPVLVKPSGGGGGKGMSVVRSADDLPDALAAARRIADAAFDDERLVLERYIEGPRHVEVQVLADAHGNTIHLGERDCSLQRRHQKILEETPAPNLDPGIRDQLHDSAIAFAKRARYVGAGTCEFLVASDGTIGFIEMNARLQVEHPVTEMVTGIDLVEQQLRVALGERLAVQPTEPNGHAIEVRLYAEDPNNDFVPQAGRIVHLRWPGGARIDAGIEAGTEISTYYDPLLAKVIVHAGDRAAALRALVEALVTTEVLGVRTNLPFLAAVVADPVVRGGRVTTDWLESIDIASLLPPSATPDRALAIAAAAEAERLAARASRDPFVTLGRAGRIVLRADGEERLVDVQPGTPAQSAVRVDGMWLVWTDHAQWEIGVGPEARRLGGAAANRLESPLPGRVVSVLVEAGQHVEAGQELLTVEAMKMEHAIKAPTAGVVRALLCAAGDQVDRGQMLVDLEPDSRAG